MTLPLRVGDQSEPRFVVQHPPIEGKRIDPADIEIDADLSIRVDLRDPSLHPSLPAPHIPDLGGNFNSHIPTVDMHRRMYKAFKPMRDKLTGGLLTVEQLIELLKARIHPSQRK
jgi:hypothetical protein